MKTTVVMPTYNEASNLAQMVGRILALPAGNLCVLVVDDNSPDGTGRIADGLAARNPGRVSVMHRAGKLGLGTAYVQGFKRALEEGADRMIQMDVDFSHNPDYLPVMLDRARDYDVVVGSRYVQGGRVDDRWSVWRKALSWWGSVYSRAVLGLKVHDTTAGFKCFRREVLESLNLDGVLSNGYAFQIEMAYLCERKGYRICEVPIVFLDRTQGKSKMSVKIALEASLRVWQIRWRY